MRHDRQRRVVDTLQDVLDASNRIAKWTSGRSFAEYQKDELLQSAVERQFEIIGEALRTADQHDPVFRTRVPETGDIIGMRNSIAHGYFAVDDSVIWSAVVNYLPTLHARIERLLSETERP